MTSPNPDNQPENRSKPRLQLLLLSRTGIAIGVTLLIGLAGGAWWLSAFIQNKLAPLVQDNLTKTIKRPVQLGRVEGFSLTGLRFGPTSLPATPTDPNHASVKAIDVAFDPLQVLLTRTLKLDITLVQPDAYVEQDQEGRWVQLPPQTEQKPGPITINLDTIRVKNAKATVVAYPKPGNPQIPFVISLNGIAHLLDQNQLISLELAGQPATGGNFKIQGESRLKTQQTNLQLQGQNLLGADLARLVKLPLSIDAGRVDGNLNVQLLVPNKPQPLVFGTAGLKAVTAKLDRLPQPFINTQGSLRFNGTQVALENVSTSFGKIPLLANGVLDTQGDFNLNARVKAVSVATIQDTFKINPPLPATGEFGADLAVKGPFLNPILLGKFANVNPIRIDRVDFSSIRSRFTFNTATASITVKDFRAIPAAGGQITGAGTAGLLKNAGVRLSAVAQNLPGDAVAHLYGVSPQIKVGSVAAKAEVSGRLGNLQTAINWRAPQATYPVSGTLTVLTAGKDTLLFRDTALNVAGGNVRVNGQLVNGRWQASGTAAGIQLGHIAQVPPVLQPPLGGRFNLSGTTASFKPGALSIQGDVSLDLAGGTLTASRIQAGGGRWHVLGNLDRINLGAVAPASLALNAPVNGTFNLSGSTASFQPETLALQGQANLNVGGGAVTASNIQVARGQWQVLGTASEIQMGQVLPRLPSQLLGTVRDGKFNFSGSLTAITPQTIQGNASGSLQVAAGTVRATNFQLFGGRWQGSFTANGVELKPLAQFALLSLGKGGFTPVVRGSLNGNVNASGSLEALNWAGVQASGQLRLLDLVAGGLKLDRVLSGNVNLAPGQGANLQLAGVQDRISLLLSPNYKPVSFLFQLGSAIATGRTQGDTLLVSSNNFPVSIFKSIVPLPAAIAAQPISGILDANLGINLNTYATDGNLAIAQPALGTIEGDQITAQFRYANGVGTLKQAEFKQGESLYTLSGAVTQTPNDTQFQGDAKITQGQIKNVLIALQSFNWQNPKGGESQPIIYGSAADVTTVPVGLPNASLLTQLGQLSEIQERLEQERLLAQQQQKASPLSSLTNLKGTFGGEISLKGSLKTGVAAKFDLGGRDWQLNNYKINRVIAQGGFENGVLTLLPVRIESAQQGLVAFSGQIGGTQKSGQLRVRNFPVNVLDNFIQLPVPITGELNATATVAGDLQNPRALGDFELTDGTLNQKPIKSAQASFSYDNARLNFGSNVVVSESEPIQITGSIPYALPFAAVKPDNDQLRLDVNVQNQGLRVLNLLTDQVAWQDGQGKVQLQVRGTIKQPLATGIATVNNATITAQALPQPLTDVTGTARFNRDRVQVESFKGNFSRGNVQAKGVIPFFAKLKPNDPDQANPLSITLNKLALNVKDLYQGGANGNVVISGAALNPVIGGNVELANGKVLLTQQVAAAAKAALSGASTPKSGPAQLQAPTGAELGVKTAGASKTVGGIVPAFNNFQLTLGKAIGIILPPILNFQANGGLIINGTLNDPRPQGTIRLTGGDVNLFTTQFTFARGYKQRVTFLPNQARDPNLHLRLVAVVPEVTQSPNKVASNSPFNFSSGSIENVDRQATDFGSLRTVRVQAQIVGPASKLIDKLELTSNPSRSKSDIYALLGGGLAQSVASGNAALGAANLAGSALLGNFQQPITKVGNAIGLSELRIFPSILNSYSSSRNSSTLGLVAEGDIDISGNLSASILRVLTASNLPTQVGLSYQLNRQLRLRTLTDFSDSRTSVEYQRQF